MEGMIELAIDGQSVEVPEGTSIWDAARSVGIEIPVLCHDPRMEAVGVCRVCAVDVGGAALVASCVRRCESDVFERGSDGDSDDARRPPGRSLGEAGVPTIRSDYQRLGISDCARRLRDCAHARQLHLFSLEVLIEHYEGFDG